MRLAWARVGGGLLVAGSIALLMAAAIVLGGRPAGTGVQSIGGIAFDLGFAFVAAGASLLAAAGQGPATRTIARIGLGILAFGALWVLASSIVIRFADEPIGAFVFQVVIGIPVTAVGLLVTGIALLWERGRFELVGRALVGGVVLLPCLVLLSNLGEGGGLRMGAIVGPVVAVAAILLIGAIGGLGYLALSDRWSWR